MFALPIAESGPSRARFFVVREQLALTLGNWNIIIFGVLFIVVALALLAKLMDMVKRMR